MLEEVLRGLCTCQMKTVRKSILEDDAYDGRALRLTNF